MRSEYLATLSATPGTFVPSVTLGGSMRFWYIHQATGSLTFKIKLKDGSSYEITRNAGFRAGESSEIESFQVASSEASDAIKVWFSDTMEWELPPLTAGGSLPVEIIGAAATAKRVDNLGLSAATASSIPTVPLGKTLVQAFISLDPAAPGPVYVGLSNGMGGNKGLQLMPGQTTPALTVADVADTTTNNISVYNPQAVGVTLYVYSEYIN